MARLDTRQTPTAVRKRKAVECGYQDRQHHALGSAVPAGHATTDSESAARNS